MANIVIQNTGTSSLSIANFQVASACSLGIALGSYDFTVPETAIIVNNGLEYVPEQQNPWVPEQLPTETIKVTDAQGLSRKVKPNTATNLTAGVYSIEVV